MTRKDFIDTIRANTGVSLVRVVWDVGNRFVYYDALGWPQGRYIGKSTTSLYSKVHARAILDDIRVARRLGERGESSGDDLQQ